jgi:predicted transposase YbfD/YdcC
VLALKGNQGKLHKDVVDYFDAPEFNEKIKKDGGYLKTVEKAHGKIEIREYYQTTDIEWIPEKKHWNCEEDN